MASCFSRARAIQSVERCLPGSNAREEHRASLGRRAKLDFRHVFCGQMTHRHWGGTGDGPRVEPPPSMGPWGRMWQRGHESGLSVRAVVVGMCRKSCVPPARPRHQPLSLLLPHLFMAHRRHLLCLPYPTPPSRRPIHFHHRHFCRQPAMLQQHVFWAAIRLYVRVPRLSLLLFSGELRVCPLPNAHAHDPNPTPCALLRCHPPVV
jgi:hypothetical protein